MLTNLEKHFNNTSSQDKKHQTPEILIAILFVVKML